MIIGKTDGHIEESNGNNYLIFSSTDKNKEVLTKCTELWDEMKYLIQAINDSKVVEYGKDFMEIRFESEDNLSFRILKLHMLTVIVRSVFEEDGKYYPETFLRRMFTWVIKLLQYDRIDASAGIDIKKTDVSKECMICHYWYFKDTGYKFKTHVCNGCHDVLMMDYELKNIAILIKSVDYRCVLWAVTKNDAINMLGNFKVDDKATLWIWILVEIKHFWSN